MSAGFALVFARSAIAQTPMFMALHIHDWAAAGQIAAKESDPVAPQIVQFIRLLSTGDAPASEIAAFINAHPTWPNLPQLRRRLADAIAAEPDANQRLAECHQYKPSGDATAQCAATERDHGDKNAAIWLARQAWIDGITDTQAEQSFLREWSTALRPEDQWRRFDTLDWAANPAADRQAARLDPPRAALAAARLAFRHNDKRAMDFLPAVPEDLRGDPTLLLAQARWLRGADAQPAALALWRAAGATAEAAAPADHRSAFYNERERLARLLLVSGDAAGAYFLADDALAGTDQAPDALFLAGWIALRRLHDPARAAAKFQALAAQSQSVITQGRAWYWLARATADITQANTDFAHAATYPTSYYGQLAALHIGTQAALQARLAALREPAPNAAATQGFATSELTRATALLVQWGDPDRARAFLLREAQTATGSATLVLAARQALAVNMPDVAVAAARLAGRQGVMLKQSGWPRPYAPLGGDNSPDPALVLALMRQESSFDPAIVSHAGAVGLMQMLPETARQQGGAASLLTDPAANIRVGEAYLQSLLTQFGGVVPYALAAYNAGPHRARAWITTNGDAAATGDPDTMLDWIEQIPFTETRNYVQRVLESRTVYAAPP